MKHTTHRLNSLGIQIFKSISTSRTRNQKPSTEEVIETHDDENDIYLLKLYISWRNENKSLQAHWRKIVVFMESPPRHLVYIHVLKGQKWSLKSSDDLQKAEEIFRVKIVSDMKSQSVLEGHWAIFKKEKWQIFMLPHLGNRRFFIDCLWRKTLEEVLHSIVSLIEARMSHSPQELLTKCWPEH